MADAVFLEAIERFEGGCGLFPAGGVGGELVLNDGEASVGGLKIGLGVGFGEFCQDFGLLLFEDSDLFFDFGDLSAELAHLLLVGMSFGGALASEIFTA